MTSPSETKPETKVTKTKAKPAAKQEAFKRRGRPAGSKNKPKKVVITATQAELAEKLGVPVAEYAKEVVKLKRKDTASRRLASRIGNGFRNAMLGDGASDTGCGLKAFHRQMYLNLPYFDHMHRFLIALAQREGFRVSYVPVNHRPRLQGASKYTNLGRLLVSAQDLLGVRWLQRRHRGPADIQEL